MAYQMVATAVTLTDLEGHSPVADIFTCNPSNICAAFYTISTDSVLAWFLWISRASCQQLSQKTAIIFELTQHVARFLCNSRASCQIYNLVSFCSCRDELLLQGAKKCLQLSESRPSLKDSDNFGDNFIPQKLYDCTTCSYVLSEYVWN